MASFETSTLSVYRFLAIGIVKKIKKECCFANVLYLWQNKAINYEHCSHKTTV